LTFTSLSNSVYTNDFLSSIFIRFFLLRRSLRECELIIGLKLQAY